MKKEKFSKKLNLKKDILSNLSNQQILGGGDNTEYCNTLTIQYPDPMPSWVCPRSFIPQEC